MSKRRSGSNAFNLPLTIFYRDSNTCALLLCTGQLNKADFYIKLSISICKAPNSKLSAPRAPRLDRVCLRWVYPARQEEAQQ